tara:strand:+ start:1608 stop:2204 length:597 start_codon:yes stop_codon:yes gene_type:complete
MTTFELVSTLYRDFLLREPDEAGVNYWADRLDSGELDIPSVINSITAGAEFQQEIQPVMDLYNVQFLRPADPSGLAYWVNEIRNGLAIEEVASNFQASVEFETTISNLDDAAWLSQLYGNVVNREPDAEGLAYWQSMLADGMPRDALASTFLNSNESVEQATVRVLKPLLGDDAGDTTDDIESLLNRYVEPGLFMRPT